MNYENIIKGKFIKRINRFVAEVLVDGKKEKSHVKNTGRCKELLIENTTVFLVDHTQNMGNRKLKYSLVGVEKNIDKSTILINMDSQAPNKVVFEALKNGKIKLDGLDNLTEISIEKTFASSRFDFKVKDVNGKEAFIEVKGVTLEKDGIAKFPDAPTSRGAKHLKELCLALDKGYLAYVIFVIQMKGISYFTVNQENDPIFASTLKQAQKNGVKIYAFDCIVKENSLLIDKEIDVVL